MGRDCKSFVQKSWGGFPTWEVWFTTEDTEGTENGKAEKQLLISRVRFFVRFARCASCAYPMKRSGGAPWGPRLRAGLRCGVPRGGPRGGTGVSWVRAGNSGQLSVASCQ